MQPCGEKRKINEVGQCFNVRQLYQNGVFIFCSSADHIKLYNTDIVLLNGGLDFRLNRLLLFWLVWSTTVYLLQHKD